jgi:CubicO group peptidase (beta-lactamase class C family)
MKIRWFVFGFIAGAVITFITIMSVALIAVHKSTPGGIFMVSIPDTAYDNCPKGGDQNITQILEPIRKKHKVPAICAAVVTSEGIKSIGAVGVRKINTDVAVTVNDKWHLGSDTKAMTSSVIGKLVENKVLDWNETLAEIFPELESVMHSQMKKVTILQLLSHRAGLKANLDWPALSKAGSLREQRYNVVKQAVAAKPESVPGEKYEYSNLGYVITGAIIEKVTNSTYEEQITKLLFEPLDMKSVGFGGTGTIGQIDQPWPHNGDGSPVSINGTAMDNPLIITSAGCVNCTMEDWSKFIVDQLKGAMQKSALLKPDTYKAIQTPHFEGEYALGWMVIERDWGNGTVLNHGGCNTMNFANVWIAPKRDFAILVCVNQGGDAGFNATDDAVGALIDFYFKEK